MESFETEIDGVLSSPLSRRPSIAPIMIKPSHTSAGLELLSSRDLSKESNGGMIDQVPGQDARDQSAAGGEENNHYGSPGTFWERSKRGGSHEIHGALDPPQQEELGSDSSGSSWSQRGGSSVEERVQHFEAAVGAVLPIPPWRKTRRKLWSESWIHRGDENAHSDQNAKIPRESDHAEDSTRSSEDSAEPSDSSVSDVARRSKSVPHSKAAQNFLGTLSRAQSAKDSSRSPPHDPHAVQDHKSIQGKSTTDLPRAKSVGTGSDTTSLRRSRRSRSGLSGWLSNLKSKVESFETKIDGVLSSPLSRRSSVASIMSMPSHTSAGLELLTSRDLSKEPNGNMIDQDADNIASTSEHGAQSEDGGDEPLVEQVALIVPTTDDPSILYWTFRTAVLGTISCIAITFLNTYFSYRNEPIVISVTTVLITTAPLGKLMASSLPDRFVGIPGTRWGFSLNPGPFSLKEHGLITIFASAGSVRPGGIFVFNMIKVFLHQHIGFLPGFMLTLTCELFGYSWAVLLYKFLVEPARFWWPASLVNVSLSQALHKDEKRKGASLISFFMICFTVTCAYYVIPGFFIPSVTSISVVCYIFKHNVLAQQLGSGLKGLGLGAFSLDWATISSFNGSPLIVPWPAVVNIVVGFLIQAYLIAPLTYWKNWFHSKNYPIFSMEIFTQSGGVFNVTNVIERTHSRLHRSKGAIPDAKSLPHFSAFFTMSTGLTFALFGAVCSQVIFFNGKDLVRTFKAAITQRSSETPDIHTRLMRKYPQIPFRWVLLVLLGTHLAAIVNLVVYKDQLEMKWWGVFLASAVTVVLVIPICILVATTNQVANLGIMPQYLMGFLRAGQPITNVMFRTYSTVVCGRTANYLVVFKLGHYMKIPPRATFYALLFSTLISALVSTAVASWLTGSIDSICDVSKLPPNSPWTCPHDRVFYDHAVMFGIAGPHRLLTKKGSPYRTLNFYFIPGFLLPPVLWLLGIALPGREWINLINAPLLFRGATLMPPSPVVNNSTWIYVALFFSIYVFNYKKKWWQRYNYILSAALDAGTVVMALLLYYSLDEGKKVLHWWGEKRNGDHCPLASCPTAPGIHHPGCPVF